MDPSSFLCCPKAARAVFASRASSAALTVSSPQQILACRRKLLVDFASPLSRNRRTDLDLPPHLTAVHSKTCAFRLSMYSTTGIGLKNAYIGASHSFDSRSVNQSVCRASKMNMTPTQLSVVVLNQLYRIIT